MPAIGRFLLVLILIGALVSPEVIDFVAATRRLQDDGSAAASEASEGSRTRPRFSITGSVRGLYAGARKRLTLRVANPHRRPMRVVSLTVAVTRSNRRGCPPGALRHPRSVARSRFVAPRSSVRMRYPIRMRRSAPESCYGATWQLEFGGRAVRFQ
jgi:hypothetical protein